MSDHFYLAHHGIKGQKWGVRRFQNEDGSLTSAGEKRYGEGGAKLSRAARSQFRKADRLQATYEKEVAKSAKKNAHERAAAEEWREAAQYHPKRKAEYESYYKRDMKEAKKNEAFRAEADREWLDMRDAALKRGARTQEYHDNAKAYWNKMSAGKKAGTVLLYGPFGAQQYSALRGSGHSRAVSAGVTMVSGAMAGPLGHTVVNNVMRSDYANKD